MAITKREAPIIVDGKDAYLIEDDQIFDAVVATTQHALDQYGDTDLLATRYDRLVAQVRYVVRDALREAEAERLNRVKPRLFDRALKAYILKEVRKRQGLALEKQLTAEFGPLEGSDAAPLDMKYLTINGVTIVEVESVDKSNTARPA